MILFFLSKNFILFSILFLVFNLISNVAVILNLLHLYPTSNYCFINFLAAYSWWKTNLTDGCIHTHTLLSKKRYRGGKSMECLQVKNYVSSRLILLFTWKMGEKDTRVASLWFVEFHGFVGQHEFSSLFLMSPVPGFWTPFIYFIYRIHPFHAVDIGWMGRMLITY